MRPAGAVARPSAPASSGARVGESRRCAAQQQQAEKSALVTAVRLRPELRAVARGRHELGYPYAEQQTLEALRLEAAERASITCLTDPDQPIYETSMPLSAAAKLAVLMCRHHRLGCGCVESMGELPQELWERIFHHACTTCAYPNMVELGPPPGSNATVGVIHEPTPQTDGTAAAEQDTRRYTATCAFGQKASQLEVYEGIGAELLDSALDGYQATILAYGPRGSGKRYTIEGGVRVPSTSPSAARASEGMLQRAIRHACWEAKRRAGALHMRLSCFAIHRKQVYDMLAPDAPSKAQLKRQDAGGTRVPAYVDELRAPTFASVDDGLQLVEAARTAQMKLPVCSACANWTREVDTFWCIYFAVPCADEAAKQDVRGVADVLDAAAVPPASPPAERPLGIFTLVNLAACGARQLRTACVGWHTGMGQGCPAALALTRRFAHVARRPALPLRGVPAGADDDPASSRPRGRLIPRSRHWTAR